MNHDAPRPDPETFLAAADIEAGEPAGTERGRGRLKIFLGASPGVGKTYAMLEEASAVHRAGGDVIVALAETHGRAETAALLSQLDQIPRRLVTYRGRQISEMDLDGLLARQPRLALIDELAHSNVPGDRHPKRWQDVEEVLDAGIDVYTTLNIQHIESLNDVVARITGVRVQETVPDAILQRASEIRLIDLSAEDLIKRMREGKVYMPAEAGRALLNFFSKPNLTALRELALRTAASRVDAEMLALTRGSGRPSAQDRLMVCLEDPATAKALVRAGRRMTDRARIPWIAATVITPDIERQGPGAAGAMTDALALAERLGAEIQILRADHADVVDELLASARRRKVSRLILGRVPRTGWRARVHARFFTPLSERILEQAADLEVTILSPSGEPSPPKVKPRRSAAGWPRLSAEALAVTAVSTLIATPFDRILPVASLAVIYLVGVLSIGMRRGTAGAVLASVMSFLAYNYFFTSPYYSLRVASHESIVALLVFTVSALFTGSLAGRLKRQVEFMRVTQARTETLYDFARKIASASTTDDVLWAAAAHIAHSLECESLILMPDEGGDLRQVQGFPAIQEDLAPPIFAAALWAYQKNTPAGSGTDTLPALDWMFLPLATQGAPIGAIGVRFFDATRGRDPETRRMLSAVEDQVAVAVERIKIESDLERARLASQTEILRAALLNSVSHDLRTPLVTVIGSLSALDQGDLPPETTAALVRGALSEAERLDRYVANLLSMTRLGHGALVARRAPTDVAELIGRAQSDLAAPLAPFRVAITLPKDLPPIMVDPVLIGQSLINLMENATKYAPEGSTIRLTAQPEDKGVALMIEDEGPGIPQEQRTRVFELFHRAIQGDGQPAGTGIGLAIVKGMIEANDGKVEAIEPPSGKGAAIRLWLPVADSLEESHGA
ncbi:sensor histidine kinase [Paracoccus aminophilus]|uniref:histidine kinase n=1 Tax=Paracoccus aminophilus JCM 7686 TaxID=1367847 RepID=S5YHT4_PARAH|nr:sensor histidine kinase KdpD [Paracoccus aminophilus]AGT11023.1 osmosensitive K+ channel signal transduction histidine kinase KdpD [Paracoccus aminophilus JCM 7686]